MNRTTRLLLSPLVLLLSVPGLALSAAQGPPGCGASFVEGFENYSNEGQWAQSGTFQALSFSGGNPEWFVRSQQLLLPTPRFQTNDPFSVFGGDWRGRGVTSTGVDLLIFQVEPAAVGRHLNLVLYHDNGTPADASDDSFVYFPAGQIPERDGNWRSYLVDVPSHSPTLPAGWSVGGSFAGSADALWNLVMGDVHRVAWLLGNPILEPLPGRFVLGFDNARLAFEDGPSTYCIAQQNSQGCSPAITWFGSPSATQLQVFPIFGNQVVNQSPGMLLYSFAPDQHAIFGGYRCIAPPLRRTPMQISGGTLGLDCRGTFVLDFNAYIRSGVDPQLVPGATVHAQYWGRDLNAAQGVSMTNALRFTICP